MTDLIKMAGLGAILSYAVVSAYHQPVHKLQAALAHPMEDAARVAVLPAPADATAVSGGRRPAATH